MPRFAFLFFFFLLSCPHAEAKPLRACLSDSTGKISIRRRCPEAKGFSELSADLVQGLGASQVGPAGPRGPAGPKGNPGPQGPAGELSSAYAHVYQLATVGTSTVVGGADIPFSTNGILDGVSHTAGTTTVTIQETGTYSIAFSVSITVGVGAAVTLALNGVGQPETLTPFLVPVGNVSGRGIFDLSSGDVVTLRNNSLVPLVVALSPSVGAAIEIVRVQ
ncbi:MAG: hypothetical protein KDD64_12800 [Bdellovibrionales bacterium]|nr:hypothetical protein [Bdellovibrionales bacterium]